MPSCNKTKMHFDDRRTAPFIPGAPVLAAGYSRVQWELGEDKVYTPARRQEIVTGSRIQPSSIARGAYHRRRRSAAAAPSGAAVLQVHQLRPLVCRALFTSLRLSLLLLHVVHEASMHVVASLHAR